MLLVKNDTLLFMNLFETSIQTDSIIHGWEQFAVCVGQEQGSDILIHERLIGGELDVCHGSGYIEAPFSGRFG